MVIFMQELMNKKILVVDDEPELLKMIEDILFSEGFFQVYTAPDCKKAMELAKTQPVALFLLDINLPDGNGFMLYQEIRKFSQAPVIFLTARGEPEVRIKALLRRTYGTVSAEMCFSAGERKVDLENAAVIKDGREIPLRAKELILIKKLWENRNKIVTNDALCMAAWGDDYYGHENNLMVQIRHLREKIEEDPSRPAHIITLKGLGYKLVNVNE